MWQARKEGGRTLPQRSCIFSIRCVRWRTKICMVRSVGSPSLMRNMRSAFSRPAVMVASRLPVLVCDQSVYHAMSRWHAPCSAAAL